MDHLIFALFFQRQKEQIIIFELKDILSSAVIKKTKQNKMEGNSTFFPLIY